MSVISLNSKSEFNTLIESDSICIIHFYTPWAAQCEVVNQVLEELVQQDKYRIFKFAKCEAEEFSELSLRYKVTAVPTVVIFSGGQVQETISGASAADITAKVAELLGVVGKKKNEKLKALINQSPVVVFMKGSPQQPRCGFSKTLIALLEETMMPFSTFDILEDEEVRQGLKEYSKWPTYPQIYVKGELIGGLDIIQELKESGDLVNTLKGY